MGLCRERTGISERTRNVWMSVFWAQIDVARVYIAYSNDLRLGGTKGWVRHK